MLIEQRNNGLFIFGDNFSTKGYIKIPSQMYPLNGTPKLFFSENTEDLQDTVKKIVDTVKFKIGHCYTNAERLTAKLQEAGFQAEEYVGWCFLGEAIPIHHAWVVVDGKSVIDLTNERELCGNYNGETLSIEKRRELYVGWIVERLKKNNSVRCVCGKVPDFLCYIGSPCSAEEGKKIYNKLTQAFPNHPCNRTDDGRSNKTQREILRRLS